MKEKIFDLLKSIVKGWGNKAILISYAIIIAIIANGWYLDIIGLIKEDGTFSATIRAEYGNIGLYEAIVCLIATAFYIAYLCFNYISYKRNNSQNMISINNKNKKQTGNNINNGVQVINNYNGSSKEQEVKEPNDIFTIVYIPYFEKIFGYFDVSNYQYWSYDLAINGETIINKKRFNNIRVASDYCLSRAKHKGYEKYDSLIHNLGILLKDLHELIYCNAFECTDGTIRIKKFYKIKEYNTDRYNHLQNIYLDYVRAIADLTFEMTRMLNYILEIVRKKKPTFLLNVGEMRIDTVSQSIEYREEEKNLSPYPGLRDFIKVNEERIPHYSGNFDYDPEIFWNV